MTALFDYLPELKNLYPKIDLMTGSTPVSRNTKIAEELGISNFWIKHDDVTALPYGGNKVRKLEFLLGKARQMGCKRVVTFGCSGSNHCLATTVYAKKVGMKCSLVMLHQPNSKAVTENLLSDLYFGADFKVYDDFEQQCEQLNKYLDELEHIDGVKPYVIPPGGTAFEGILGYVNAAFELVEQIKSNQLEKPDEIWLPLGTMGTAVGLITGFGIAGVPIKICGVRVVPEFVGCESLLKGLLSDVCIEIRKICDLHECDRFEHAPYKIIDDFFGEAYGLFTEDGMRAVKFGKQHGISLEGCYTGKAFAALMKSAKAGELKDKKVLYWLTKNSHQLGKAKSIDGLPDALKKYFSEDYQPLDLR